MVCHPTALIFVSCADPFGNCGRPFSRLHRKIAVTVFTVMLFVCVIRAAEFGVPGYFSTEAVPCVTRCMLPTPE